MKFSLIYNMASTEDLVTPSSRTIHDLARGGGEKEQTDPILLNFTKAFDKVTNVILNLTL